MTETEPVSSAQHVANTLREMVLMGRIGPGTPLREAALSAELEVSRNTLREGIRLLVAEGLVEQQLYSGAVVATVGPAEVRDLYTVRRTVEIRAVQLSVYASERQFAALRKTIEDENTGASNGDWRSAATAGMRFHQELVGLIGSTLLDEFFARIAARLRLAFVGWTGKEELHAPWLERDKTICELLIAGRRGEAAAELERYLADSEQQVIDLVRQHQARSAAKQRARKGLKAI